jgi:general stress protein 14
MGYTIDEFLACYKATCRLTHMEYCGSVYTCGVSYGNRTTPELIEQQRNVSVAHAERLIELFEML